MPDAEPMRLLAHSVALAPLGGVEICTLQDAIGLAGRGHSLGVAHGADGPLRAAYEAAGIDLDGPHRFGFDPRTALRDVRAFSRPARWARQRATEVVWLNRVEHLPWGQAVARWSGAALVCHLHAPPPFRWLRPLAAGVDHLVAISGSVRDAYLDRGVDPARVTLVPNALPPRAYPRGDVAERAAARAQLGLPPDAPVVLCYGHLSRAKGVPELLRAWTQLASRRPDALLVLVDSLSAEPDPVVAAQLAQLDPRSYRLFPMATDVVPFLHAADVVAFPTLLPETFGRVVLEGLATGRPVVASRVGAVPELLSGPMARFLVPPGDADRLAVTLAGLLDWRRDEPGLGAECVAWVERHWSFPAHLDLLEGVLATARDAHRRRPGHRAPA
ncbi:glycosyltransferase family 4 protein [Modestobacter muralis]|uniref:Glycosyltransferase family 4 protein n=1 Tax=Modestobacter muralis TaxID=1608614 RepID=A0A6P0HBZ0_9ACTN|nr:glycosyltransferase family 4 protein [Modestobacter muralis]NEK96441.1 glycosyltransferase family 4 protein [Modestobacter muralis]NEN53341.1 glycosyltransferase family 4 protein [Modestobacter muralis]